MKKKFLKIFYKKMNPTQSHDNMYSERSKQGLKNKKRKVRKK